MATASRLYVFSALGLNEPQISIEPDSVVIHSARIDYSFVIYYPRELHDEMLGCFSSCLLSLKREYALYVDPGQGVGTSGEHLGEMLRQFKTLERLIRVVSARRCWDENKVLVLHGLESSQFLSSLRNELNRAGIKYLIILPLNDELGSGVFKTLKMQTAVSLVSDLKAERPRAVESALSLDDSYGPHTMVSNSDSWA